MHTPMTLLNENMQCVPEATSVRLSWGRRSFVNERSHARANVRNTLWVCTLAPVVGGQSKQTMGVRTPLSYMTVS